METWRTTCSHHGLGPNPGVHGLLGPRLPLLRQQHLAAYGVNGSSMASAVLSCMLCGMLLALTYGDGKAHPEPSSLPSAASTSSVGPDPNP